MEKERVYCRKCKWMLKSGYNCYCRHPKSFRYKTSEDSIYGIIHEKIFKIVLCCEKNKDFNCPDFKSTWWRIF